MFRRVVKGVKLITTGVVIGGSVIVLHKNDWDVTSIGVVRFGRAAVTAVKCVIDYKYSLRNIDPATEAYKEMLSKAHQRSAVRLREMCCSNGGCFIKVGQHIGALDYLFPSEYVTALKVLHSNAPQSPVEQLYKVIKEDLGKDVTELFQSFSPEPQGTASLAQVHKAVLHNGETVAVKVQHPKVKAHSVVDIATMEFLAKTVAWIFPEFKFVWMAEETKANLPIELDFVQEAHNCERVSKILSRFDFLKVPKVYWNLSSERVLTMEFCEGGQVNDLAYMRKHNINVNEISQNLGKMYSEMIFVHGYIHCDPHPGNVLVNKTDSGTQIVLLDHGLYVTLSDEFRLNYCKLWQSFLNANLNKIKKYAQKMGTGELYPLYSCMVTARSWKSLTKGMDKEQKTQEEAQEIRNNVAAYLPEISEILNRVPRQMLFIFKTNDLLRGIESALQTEANAQSFIPMSKCCVRAVYRHKKKHCHSFIGGVKLSVLEQWALFKITIFQIFLWVKCSALVKRTKSLS